MSVQIIFESHSTSLDNEKDLASGWNDVELSELGRQQAADLGRRRGVEQFEVIFCSDMQRSYMTAEIAFGKKFPVLQDTRLRECDYGELTQHPAAEVKAQRTQRISSPYPGGESYEQAAARMKSFLTDLFNQYDGKRILIIGHRATQYGLEYWIQRTPLSQVVTTPWKWQPGWGYELIQKL